MKRQRCVMIYGATGFTGSLVARAARKLRCKFVLAGRDPERLGRAAYPLGLAVRVFALDEPRLISDALADIDVVLNAAGPFAATSAPLIAACLAAGAHYLDVTGELSVFAAAHRNDATARVRGIMIMPGVGFTIVASDCLAADVASLLPGAKYLRFGMSRPELLSRGSLRTVFAEPRGRIAIRRAAQLRSVPVGQLEREFDYGKGEQASAAFSLADIYTAYLTTGIPNIEAYVESSLLARATAPFFGLLTEAVRITPLRQLFELGLVTWPERPSLTAHGVPRQVIVAEAEDGWRRSRRVRLVTTDGYRFTAAAATAVLERVISGDFAPGFQTPGKLYGPALALSIPGTIREDLDQPSQRGQAVLW